VTREQRPVLTSGLYALTLFVVFFFLGACATVPEAPPDDPVTEHLPDDLEAERELTAELLREHRLVEQHMATMDLRERIGQRFMIFIPRGFTPELAFEPVEPVQGTDGTHPADPPDAAESRESFAPTDPSSPHDSPGGVADERAGEPSEEPESPAVRFRRTVNTGNPAGMIVYRWNYEDREDVIRLTETLQSMAARSQPGRGLLISADQEGGRVAAFRFNDIVRPPSQAAVGRHRDPFFVESLAYVVGRELAAMGVNMNLAPVLDLTAIPDSSIIGDRAWGDEAELASRFSEGYVRGMARAGVIATAKHFPGHGVTRVDSHGRLPIVTYTMDDLRARELRPFAAAVAAEVPVVMTAHILFPEIDPDYPVTISEIFLRGLLRDEMGFEGVVISDGLEMGALAANFDLDTTLERAIRAEVDLILLYTRYDLLDVIDRVEAMVLDGRLTEEQIDRGVERILALKYRYGLLHAP
jgi:beta-N-acetylhexosaminidase